MSEHSRALMGIRVLPKDESRPPKPVKPSNATFWKRISTARHHAKTKRKPVGVVGQRKCDEPFTMPSSSEGGMNLSESYTSLKIQPKGRAMTRG